MVFFEIYILVKLIVAFIYNFTSDMYTTPLRIMIAIKTDFDVIS